jgi:hypothetical protein
MCATRNWVIPVTFIAPGLCQGGTIRLEAATIGGLGIFIAAHGVVTALTIYPQPDAYSCDGSNC